MTEDTFWQIVQRSYDRCGGHRDEQAETLAEELETLSPEEIADFDRHFEVLRLKAFTWDLWGAAYIIGGGCSDDAFLDFLSWLISRGKGVYERALVDADSLAVYPKELDDETAFFEEFAYVASDTYEHQVGELPDYELPPWPEEPAGEHWPEEDVAALRARWPRLWEKYAHV